MQTITTYRTTTLDYKVAYLRAVSLAGIDPKKLSTNATAMNTLTKLSRFSLVSLIQPLSRNAAQQKIPPNMK